MYDLKELKYLNKHYNYNELLIESLLLTLSLLPVLLTTSIAGGGFYDASI